MLDIDKNFTVMDINPRLGHTLCPVTPDHEHLVLTEKSHYNKVELLS